jgi:SAM-dependent methyltransferase
MDDSPADYGIDAPGVVRNLVLVGVAGLGVWAGVAVHLWPGRFRIGPVSIDLAGMPLTVAVACLGLAGYMVWSSKQGKVTARERLLDQLQLRGAERVLDVGCGRGLMLIGAAKRLTSGSAVGVDIWQSVDLSGNRAEETLRNARAEGVADRVRVETADMRKLPFPDGSFDLILSRAAIHNLYQREDRARALAEIARVLAPGGRVVIDDIRHLPEYSAELRKAGLTEVAREGNALLTGLLALLTWGSLRPGVVRARKA